MTTIANIGAHSGATIAGDHWAAHARQWSRIGSPLRPHADDIATMRDLLTRHFSQQLVSSNRSTETDQPAGCGLLLGVTPELIKLYPHIVALDRDRAMLDMLRGATPTMQNGVGNNVIQGTWLQLPFANHSLEFAIGDGSFNLLRYPQDYHTLFEQLRMVLKPDAPLLLRIFTAPALGESCAAVIAAAYAGSIASFHAFKWRFAMALVTRNRNPNVGVADIYREFIAWIPDRCDLASSTGWPLSAIDTIDVYRNSPAVYSFPTAEEWNVIAARHGDEYERSHGGYELAERCPIVRHHLHV